MPASPGPDRIAEEKALVAAQNAEFGPLPQTANQISHLSAIAAAGTSIEIARRPADHASVLSHAQQAAYYRSRKPVGTT